jgi:hypothetical protein
MARHLQAKRMMHPEDEPEGLPERIRQLESLSSLARGWDGYTAEPPNATALGNGRNLLEALSLMSVVPERVVPSADGGVALVLSAHPTYRAIECFNDGEIVASLSDRAFRHEAWETGLSPSALRATLENLGFIPDA